MWKFTRIQPNGRSPLAEIMARCSNVKNLCLVVYNLSANRVDCAAIAPDQAHTLSLSSDVVREIINDTRCNKYAVLAYDRGTSKVYVVSCVRELNEASALLLCVVSELMGVGMNHHCEGPCHCESPFIDDEDEDEDEEDYETSIYNETYGRAPEVVKRDARGRFVPKSAKVTTPDMEKSSVTRHRLRLVRR